MTSTASNNNFIFTVEKLPISSKLVQSVTLPTLILGETLVQSSLLDFSEPSEKIQYQDLDFIITLDSNWTAWLEIYNWMLGFSNPENIENRKVLYSDAKLIILDDYKKELFSITFEDCWPTTLTALELDIQGEVPLSLPITMKFTKTKITTL